MKKLYYAHAICIYNTQQEVIDLEIISKIFNNYEIINPNSDYVKDNYKGDMNFFKDIVQECDLLVFRALPNGKIPSGIAKEISYADEKEIISIELPCYTGRIMSVEDTRQFLKEIGAR